MHCAARGTDGLDELLLGLHDEHDYVGHVKSTFGLYSRFQPQSRPPPFVRSWKHPAGDIPGSRTYRPPNEPAPPKDPDDIVSETVTVDAHDLFSQLQAFAYLGKREPTRGLLQSIQGVSEGTIRIWREWLSKQCESKRWSDGETIAIHHDAPASPIDKGKGRADSGIAPFDPTQDSSILWLNTRDNNLGIRLKVRERKWRRNAPVLFKSDIEVPVSYVVEFDGKLRYRPRLSAFGMLRLHLEVFVRSMHLLLKLEEAQKMVHDQTGKAIVFGSFRG